MCTDMTPTSANGTLTELRPASNLRSLSNLLLGDPELPPFTVEPRMGLILPGTNQIFHIRFSPLELANYEARLVCRSVNQQQLLVLNSRMKYVLTIKYWPFFICGFNYILYVMYYNGYHTMYVL